LTQEIQYTIQLGTAFDEGQQLIWSLVVEPWLADEGLFVHRPRFYRPQLRRLAESGASAGPDDLREMFFLDQKDPDQDMHLVLNVIEPMQPELHFYHDGKWFAGLGSRAARLRAVLAPSPLKFVLSLRNPALLLSDALASGNYPSFEKEIPDPLKLCWADVLRDLRTHVPDASIAVWSAEEAPLIWGPVLSYVGGAPEKLTLDAHIHLAKFLMNDEGGKRLTEYLRQHPDLTDDLRARVISIFIDKFTPPEKLEADVVIPGWSEDKQIRMDALYAADLEQVAKIDGVTFITV